MSLVRSTLCVGAEVFFHRGEDLLRRLGPVETSGIVIPGLGPRVDGLDQVLL